VKLNENTISNLLTLIIFILVGALLFNYFRSINKVEREQTSSTSTAQSAEIEEQLQASKTVEEVVKTGFPAQYTVKKGDSLWKISESAYGTGYDWVQVYEANKATISDPNMLEVGTKISLPEIKVEPVEYTITRGDNLWNIALSTCHNGYLWTKIAEDNNISTPNLIEPGMKLTIKCR
jgi:nucleoid-associated protein YgaU